MAMTMTMRRRKRETRMTMKTKKMRKKTRKAILLTPGVQYTSLATKSCSCSAMQASAGYLPPTLQQHDQCGVAKEMKTTIQKKRTTTASQAQDMTL
jgi:hypothetical protein